MATQVQFRGGTTAQHGSFTGAVREVTVDTDKETVVVHDGSTAGGFPLARQDGSNVTNFVVGGTLGVTGVLTTTAATVFNGGFASNAASTLTVTEGNHVNGLKLINSEPGGYGSALTFQSERSDNNAIVSAAQIRTQGQDSWNSEASADSNLFFATSLNGSLTDKMVIKDDGNVGIGTSSPDYLVEVEKANGDHTGTAIAITNSQDGGYGSVLNFVSKRDGAGNVIASQIGTQGQSSWNSDASTSSNLLFSTVNANTLAERMRITSAGNVGINTSSPTAGYMLHVGGSSGVHTKVKIEATTATGQAELDLSADPAGVSYLNLGDEDSHNIGYLGYFHSDNSMRFQTNGAEAMRIMSYASVLFGTTNASPAEGTTAGTRIGGTGATQISVTGQPVLLVNRVEDGEVVTFLSAGTSEGSISISGTTTSYNAFSGSHWSRLSDNSKPTILKGTVIETIDEMCEWYQAQITVPKTDDTDEYIIKKSIALPDGKSVGDTISITYEGITYDDAIIIKEADNKHTKCKISDTADSKRVYGVLQLGIMMMTQ
jgi:hypothetical protein